MSNDWESLIAFFVCLIITGPVGFLLLAFFRWGAGQWVDFTEWLSNKGDK